MGEAKRRQDARLDAMANGRLWKPDPICPACSSHDVRRVDHRGMPAELARHFTCDLGACLDCRAIWEAFPAAGYFEDPVCAEPCDNCAFRPGSPEQADRDGWRSLIDSLSPGDDGWFQSQFYCHKGVPIDMERGPGNFVFPERPVMMDGSPVLEPSTGKPAMTYDLGRMRTCSGFLRMFWRLREKYDAALPFVGQDDERLRRHECLEFPFRTSCAAGCGREVIVHPWANGSDALCTECAS